jgi:hypothetical protein
VQAEVAMADVFVSYSRQDKARAAQFVQLLEGYGWDVFWDQETRAGTIWPKVLEDELGLARCLLVLWTANSVASRWVRIEAYEALQNDKLLPVRLENVKPPMEFRQTQTFDLLDWTGDPNDPRLDHLIADFCVLTKLGPRKGTIGPATLNVVRTLVPTTLGASTWQAPATLSGAPDFSGHVVPTYRSVGLAAPTLVPAEQEREAAHETEQSKAVDSAIRVDTISLRVPATATVGGYSATTAEPRQVVESAASAESGAAEVAPGAERIRRDSRLKRVSLGLGAAAIALAIVWLGGRVLQPNEVSDPEPFKSQTSATKADSNSPVAVTDPAPPPTGMKASTAAAAPTSTAGTTAADTATPTSTPSIEGSRPATAAKSSGSRPSAPSSRCIEITERFQQTGQITAADRQFLSSKECSR